jgi:hypothetical protein
MKTELSSTLDEAVRRTWHSVQLRMHKGHGAGGRCCGSQHHRRAKLSDGTETSTTELRTKGKIDG